MIQRAGPPTFLPNELIQILMFKFLSIIKDHIFKYL